GGAASRRVCVGGSPDRVGRVAGRRRQKPLLRQLPSRPPSVRLSCELRRTSGDGRMARVRTAVFPVAGRGTRFLPATKASPKEMLPIVDKPLIQYAVEEALAAGVEKLVFVTGSSKRSIEDHFDVDPELERMLAESGKEDLLALVRNIVPSHVSCLYV